MKIVGLIFELLGLVLFGIGSWLAFQAGLSGEFTDLIKAMGFMMSSVLPLAVGNTLVK